MAAAPSADPEEAGLTLALEALPNAHDGLGADVKGARQIGQGGQPVQGAVYEAADAGAEVVGAMGGEEEGEGEVGDAVPVEENDLSVDDIPASPFLKYLQCLLGPLSDDATLSNRTG